MTKKSFSEIKIEYNQLQKRKRIKTLLKAGIGISGVILLNTWVMKNTPKIDEEA